MKKITLGYIPYEEKKAKNKVEVTLELKTLTASGGEKRNWETGKIMEVTGLHTFSCCGAIWKDTSLGGRHDHISGGQNLDKIAEYVKTPLFQEIHRLWKMWHLNDICAGIKVQDAVIDKWVAEGNKYEYDAACELLKKENLYQVKSYKYGHEWCFKIIPEADVKLIQHIMTTGKLP